MPSFSTSVWWPCACMHMRSETVCLKLEEEWVSYWVLCVQYTYKVCLNCVVSRELPCVHALIIAVNNVFCYCWLNNIIMVSSMINLIRLWYPLMYSDFYDIWFLGGLWLAWAVRGDFITLAVSSQETSSEWVKEYWLVKGAFQQGIFNVRTYM